jgi:hypothetical protein
MAYSRGGRHRRKASRADLYKRAIESESYITVQKHRIGGASRKKRFPQKDTESGVGSALKDDVDDILPEHAADAVRFGWKNLTVVIFFAAHISPFYNHFVG